MRGQEPLWHLETASSRSLDWILPLPSIHSLVWAQALKHSQLTEEYNYLDSSEYNFVFIDSLHSNNNRQMCVAVLT